MRTSRATTLTLQLGAALVVLLLGLIFVFLVQKSLPFFMSEGLARPFTDSLWNPSGGQYNLVPMIAGSLLVTLGSVLLAAPMGIMVAIFARYYSPPMLAKFYIGVMELLSGIPSVVYGLWGLVYLVPVINRIAAPGASILAAILVLALMILPLVVLSVHASFEHVPAHWIKSAVALNLSRWGMISKIILPGAKKSIVAGITLQVGRALGETMAVLMVAGNIVQIPHSLFEPVRVLTANIAMEMGYATGTHMQALFVSGLIILLLTCGLVILVTRLKATQYE